MVEGVGWGDESSSMSDSLSERSFEDSTVAAVGFPREVVGEELTESGRRTESESSVIDCVDAFKVQKNNTLERFHHRWVGIKVFCLNVTVVSHKFHPVISVS